MNTIFPLYTKPTIFLSGITGLVLGILLAIPIIQLFVIFLFLFVGALLMLMLLQNRLIEQPQIRDAVIVGIISGFTSVIFASISFLPLSLLINTFTKMPFLASFFGSLSAFVVLIMFIICLAFMNVIINILSALLVVTLMNKAISNNTNNSNIFKK